MSENVTSIIDIWIINSYNSGVRGGSHERKRTKTFYGRFSNWHSYEIDRLIC